MTIDSEIEQQTLYLQTGNTQYKADTSIYYDDLPTTFSNRKYALTSFSFDNTYMLLPEVLVFQFEVAGGDARTSAGRAIWIDIPTVPLAGIEIVRMPQGNLAVFNYPGPNKFMYGRIDEDWQLIAPIMSNIIYIADSILNKLKELAIVDGQIEDGQILIRRTLDAYTVTT